jgi:hypothetical protein
MQTCPFVCLFASFLDTLHNGRCLKHASSRLVVDSSQLEGALHAYGRPSREATGIEWLSFVESLNKWVENR